MPTHSNNPQGADSADPSSVPPPHAKRRPIQILVWVLMLGVFGLAFYWVLHRHDDTATTAGAGGAGGGRAGGGRRGAAGGNVPVVPATAKKGNIGVYQEAIGTVTPVYTSSVTSQVNGIVTEVHYAEGQYVAKGAPLVEIDSRQYKANLLTAQGTLERDMGLLAQARMDLERYQDAWKRNAIPKQQLDDQEKLVQQDEGLVKQDQGTVQFDQVQVDFCHITAPFSGRVGLRLVDPGNVVSANGGTTLAVITQIQPITVVFTVPEDALGQIVPRVRARLPVDAYDRTAKNKITSGTLLTLDNQIDTTTGTVKARAQFANAGGVLYPNEFVNARLLINTLKDATLIPSSTIQHNGTASFVYVLANNKAQMRSVNVGVTDGDTSQVTGVNPGEVVANSSFDKLQPNAQVTLSKLPAANSGTGSTAP